MTTKTKKTIKWFVIITTKTKKTIKWFVIIIAALLALFAAYVIVDNLLYNREQATLMERDANLVQFQSPDGQTELTVLGTIHGAHYEEGSDYTLADLLSVIKVVQPDLLLVEVRQETFDEYGVLDGPFEMMLAWSYAEEAGIPVRGIDWWQITEDSLSNTTTNQRDDHIYDNIMRESADNIMRDSAAGYSNILVLCGATHRVEQSKRLLDNGYTEIEIPNKPVYFGAVSPEDFVYPASLRAILEKKAGWSETAMLDEIAAGTEDQSEANLMWKQNAANMVASIERMINELLIPNSLFYSADGAASPASSAAAQSIDLSITESTSAGESSIPEMSPENQAYYDKYLSAWGLYNPWGRSYTEETFAEDFRPYLLFQSSVIQEGSEEEFAPYKESCDYPAELVEAVVTRHFPLTAEPFRESLPMGENTAEYYDPDKNVYHFEGGVGGGEMVGAVTNAVLDGDELTLECSWYYDPSTPPAFSHTVTIMLGEGEDAFYYAENVAAETLTDEPIANTAVNQSNEEAAMETLTVKGETHYLVSDEAQLRAICTDGNALTKDYLQQADIQLSSEEWIPIGTEDKPFMGSYNGNGFEIKGLTMTNPNAKIVGMFGYAENADLYNITLRDLDITGAGRDAAGKTVGAVLAMNLSGARSYDNSVYAVTP